MSREKLEAELKSLENLEKKRILQGFFKTGKGQYGEGDVFLGITVPMQRAICRKYELELFEIEKLLQNKIHEFRLCGLLILVRKFERVKTEKEREKIVRFYTKNYARINNWDLVDLSAPKILGEYLVGKKDRKVLYKMARCKNLWAKRISIVSTYALIRQGEVEDTFKLAEILMKDKHDLIHKAVGWMLREAGKRKQGELEKFLDKWSKKMPRTMLRYSIEKFDKKTRDIYMGRN